MSAKATAKTMLSAPTLSASLSGFWRHPQIYWARCNRSGASQLFFQWNLFSEYLACFYFQRLLLLSNFGPWGGKTKLRKTRNHVNYAGKVHHICGSEQQSFSMIFWVNKRLKIHQHRSGLQLQFPVAVAHWYYFVAHPVRRNILVERRLFLDVSRRHVGCL